MQLKDKATLQYLCSCGKGNPSRDQEICGVGDPRAMHLRVTAGPGCRVWAMKRYIKRGAEAKREMLTLDSKIFLKKYATMCDSKKIYIQMFVQ